MKAFYRDDNSAIDANGLEANGVIYRRLSLDAAQYQPVLDDLRTRRRKPASSEEKTAAPLGRISITLVSVVLGVRPLQDDRDFANARGESQNQKYDGECGLSVELTVDEPAD